MRERAVYFQGWFPRQHNYHPARPPRRLRMIDDLEAYRATLLVWSALGGGSISLPYLEQEAWGSIDARFRMYGFVNESEFIAAAQARGIKVSGTVFECQGWEFPAELNEDGTEFLALNEERGVGTAAWAGLREFSQDALPGVWAPFASYFPDGLRNSDGEPVTDLLEECCSRAADGDAAARDLARVPGPQPRLPVHGPQQPGLARVPEGDRADPDRRGRGRRAIRRDGDAARRAAVRRLLLQGLHEGLRGASARAARAPAGARGRDLDDFHYGRWLQERGLVIDVAGHGRRCTATSRTT